MRYGRRGLRECFELCVSCFALGVFSFNVGVWNSILCDGLDGGCFGIFVFVWI